MNISKVYGKTIAVVYSFENEERIGFSHYHFWTGEIIAEWLKAIVDLKCVPYIIDVSTFIKKTINSTMPQIDCVINLNCGGNELSSMAVIPSICSLFNYPCIPCSAPTIIYGEDKLISNYIAKAIGLNVAKDVSCSNPSGIYRPRNLGSSIGVKRGPIENKNGGIYQEFIKGYDITTPIVYNPVSKKMSIMPSILYDPNMQDLEWFLDDKHKERRTGFERKIVPLLSEELANKYLEIISILGINTFCRIDARIKCNSKEQLMFVLSNPLSEKDTWFVEINPMPTIWINNAFSFSYDNLTQNMELFDLKDKLQDMSCDNVYTFLLASSLLRILEPNAKIKRI